MSKELTVYQPVIDEIKDIIAAGLNSAYQATNLSMINTYWNVGRRIVEQEQEGKLRAQYGSEMIKALSQELMKEYGKGFSERNLHYFRKFYLSFPDPTILHTCVQNLSWSHFRCLFRELDPQARLWYLRALLKIKFTPTT